MKFTIWSHVTGKQNGVKYISPKNVLSGKKVKKMLFVKNLNDVVVERNSTKSDPLRI